MIISVANQKGGVGKTTATMNLGVALSLLKKKVLLIDNDPQANLTSYLNVTPGKGLYEDLRTLDEIYTSKKIQKNLIEDDFIVSTEQGVDLIAADQNLSGIDYYLLSRADKEFVLKKALVAIQQNYDFILIDNPPSNGLLTLNAFCASDGILIPIQAEFFSLEGVVKIREIVNEIQKRYHSDLKIIGVLPNQISSRRKLTNEVLSLLKDELGDLVFQSMISDSVAITESSGQGKSVFVYSKANIGAHDFNLAAKELLKRVMKKDVSNGRKTT